MTHADPAISKNDLQRIPFGRVHLYLFLACYLAFAGLTALALSRQSESDRRANWNGAATAGAVLGPLTGGIARGGQGCCMRHSLSLLPAAAACLALAAACQWARFPAGWASTEKAFHWLTWLLGLLAWFGSGILSLGHALS